jgi:beta-lactam-binding protein with PASTA domain
MPVTTQIVYQRHATIPAGEVISQDPPEGEVVDPNGGVVTLYVSSGPGNVSYVRMTERRGYAVFRESRA